MSDSNEAARILQQEIARLHDKEEDQRKTIDALRQEFSNANDPQAITQVARKAIIELMPIAVIQMKGLLEYSDSDSVRAGLARFIVSTALDKTKFEDDSDSTIKDLLSQLAQNDPAAS